MSTTGFAAGTLASILIHACTGNAVGNVTPRPTVIDLNATSFPNASMSATDGPAMFLAPSRTPSLRPTGLYDRLITGPQPSSYRWACPKFRLVLPSECPADFSNLSSCSAGDLSSGMICLAQEEAEYCGIDVEVTNCIWGGRDIAVYLVVVGNKGMPLSPTLAPSVTPAPTRAPTVMPTPAPSPIPSTWTPSVSFQPTTTDPLEASEIDCGEWVHPRSHEFTRRTTFGRIGITVASNGRLRTGIGGNPYMCWNKYLFKAYTGSEFVTLSMLTLLCLVVALAALGGQAEPVLDFIDFHRSHESQPSAQYEVGSYLVSAWKRIHYHVQGCCLVVGIVYYCVLIAPSINKYHGKYSLGGDWVIVSSAILFKPVFFPLVECLLAYLDKALEPGPHSSLHRLQLMLFDYVVNPNETGVLSRSWRGDAAAQRSDILRTLNHGRQRGNQSLGWPVQPAKPAQSSLLRGLLYWTHLKVSYCLELSRSLAILPNRAMEWLAALFMLFVGLICFVTAFFIIFDALLLVSFFYAQLFYLLLMYCATLFSFGGYQYVIEAKIMCRMMWDGVDAYIEDLRGDTPAKSATLVQLVTKFTVIPIITLIPLTGVLYGQFYNTGSIQEYRKHLQDFWESFVALDPPQIEFAIVWPDQLPKVPQSTLGVSLCALAIHHTFMTMVRLCARPTRRTRPPAGEVELPTL